MSLLYLLFLWLISSGTTCSATFSDSKWVKNINIIKRTRGSTGNPLKVTTVYSPPFVIPHGGRLRGFIPDLLSEITRLTGFHLTLEKARDGRYGSLTTKHGHVKWNGVMGEVIDNKADIAAADLTVTSTRERYVDFTAPFIATRLKVMLKKRKNDRSPQLPKTLAELVAQKYKLLVIGGGSTHAFLKNSRDPFYRSLVSKMTKDNFVSSIMDGIRRLRSWEKVAFMTEGTTIDMITSRVYYCGYLTSLPQEYGPVSFFALAVRQSDVALKETLSTAILKLEEMGSLDYMRKKWWKSECEH